MKQILELLKEKTNCSFSIEYNPHKIVYETVEQYFEKVSTYAEDLVLRITGTEMDEMIKSDTIIYLHWYKDTPVGFYSFYCSSFDDLLKEINDILEELK